MSVRGLKERGLEVPKVQRSREKKKEEKRIRKKRKKVQHRRIMTAINFYIVLPSFFICSSFFIGLVLVLRI